MLRILISAILYLITMFTQAQVSSEQTMPGETKPVYDIKVRVGRINSDQGNVYFALYPSAEAFAARKSLQSTMVKAKSAGVEVTFEKVPPGVYAISSYHDENGNGKMDFSTNGIPMEDYGMSNNVMNFGPPRFNDAKFEVIDKDLTFDIRF